MDEDIRDRFKVPRRDYSSPDPRPHQPAPQPAQRPHHQQSHHQPQHHATHHPQPKPHNPFHNKPKPENHSHNLSGSQDNPFLIPDSMPMPRTLPNTLPQTVSRPVHHPKPAEHHHSNQTQHQAQPAVQPKTIPHHNQYLPKKRTGIFKKLTITLLIVAMIGAIAAGGYLWVYPKYIHTNPFPAQIQNQAQFSLYYPGKLPSGFKVDASSMHTSNGSVIFNATKGNVKLVFTAQKAPPGLDFNKFYQEQLADNQQFSTSYGPVVIGINDHRHLGSLVAGNTWLLLSTNDQSVSYDDMALVMHNLKKY